MLRLSTGAWVLALYGIFCSLSLSGMGLASTTLLLGAAFFLVRRPESRQALRRHRGALICGVAWLLVEAIYLFWLPWDTRSAHALGRLPLILVPLAALSWPRDPSPPRARRAILQATVLALGVAIAWALVQFAQTRSPTGSFLKNSIYWAYGLLALGIYLGGEAFDSLDLRLRRWARAGFLLALLGSLLAANRVVPFCLLAFAVWKLPRRSSALLVATSLLVGGLLYSLSPFFQDKVSRTLSLFSDPSFEWRRVAWKHNWELFLQYPLLGVGPEKNGLDPALHPEVQGHWIPNHLYFAHNVFLQSLADAGLVGTFLFLGFFASLAYRLRAARPLLLLSALAGLLENTWNNSKALHPLLFALAVYLYFDEETA